MRWWYRQKSNSGEIARKRIKMVIISDKVHCSPAILEMVKDDMIMVLSKYMEIDSGQFELAMTRTEIPALCASIPIRAISNKGID